MKYIPEATTGRVQSITSPILGFALNPTIIFTPLPTFKSKWDFTPTAHTCS